MSVVLGQNNNKQDLNRARRVKPTRFRETRKKEEAKKKILNQQISKAFICMSTDLGIVIYLAYKPDTRCKIDIFHLSLYHYQKCVSQRERERERNSNFFVKVFFARILRGNTPRHRAEYENIYKE